MAVPAARVAVLDGDELLDGVLAVAGHGRRLAHGGGHEAPVHDEHAVVVAGVALLDDDLVADLLGARERLAQVLLVADAGGDALAVVAVVRLDDDRVAEPLGVLDGGLDARTTVPLGTGMPASSSMCLVSRLLPAVSTPIMLVREVMEASMRRWYLPSPSWTRL